jgi:hypothetical protein
VVHAPISSLVNRPRMRAACPQDSVARSRLVRESAARTPPPRSSSWGSDSSVRAPSSNDRTAIGDDYLARSKGFAIHGVTDRQWSSAGEPPPRPAALERRPMEDHQDGGGEVGRKPAEESAKRVDGSRRSTDDHGVPRHGFRELGRSRHSPYTRPETGNSGLRYRPPSSTDRIAWGSSDGSPFRTYPRAPTLSALAT